MQGIEISRVDDARDDASDIANLHIARVHVEIEVGFSGSRDGDVYLAVFQREPQVALVSFDTDMVILLVDVDDEPGEIVSCKTTEQAALCAFGDAHTDLAGCPARDNDAAGAVTNEDFGCTFDGEFVGIGNLWHDNVPPV